MEPTIPSSTHLSSSIVDVERITSCHLMPSSSSSTPISTTRLSSSTPKLGDFSKLHDSMPALSSSDDSSNTSSQHDGPVKLGNFSRVFSQLSQKPAKSYTSKTSTSSDAMARTNPQNVTPVVVDASQYVADIQLAAYMQNMSLLNNAAYAANSSARWAQYAQYQSYIAQQNVMAAHAQITNIHRSLAVHSETDEPRSPNESDSDLEGVCTPASTPPSSAEKDISPIAAAARAGKAPSLSTAPFVPGPPRPAIPPLLSYQLYKGGAHIPINLPRRSKDKKHESLSMHLVDLRTTDTLLAKEHPDITNNGVHVFLDMSNINISFHHTLRVRNKLPDTARFVPLPNLNIEFLTELLVRGRDTKVLNVGCSVQPGRSEPPYVEDLRKLNYRVDLRERKPLPEASPQFSRNHKSSGAGYSSDEALINNACAAAVAATRAAAKTRYAEDLVDETLQTRIAESVMEYYDRRGTLVLATGDAKPAKFSDGFFAYAERALKMGWHVEVVSWKSSLSSAWCNPAWTEQWAGRFRVIELDDFLDDLLACYA